MAKLLIRCTGALALLSNVAAGAAAVSPDVRLTQMNAEALRTAASPTAMAKIPALLEMSAAFRRADQPGKAGAALNIAAIYALLGGDLPRALSLADDAARLCTSAGDRRCHGRAMNQSAIALLRLNDPYAAMQRLDRAYRAFVAVGDVERAAIARLNAANIRYDTGDLPAALAGYDAIEKLYGNDARWDPVGLLNSKAEVLVRLGRPGEARQTARRAASMLDQRQRSSDTRWESDVVNSTRGTLALAEASLGNATAALPLYRAYLASAERSGSPLERFNANFAFAEGLLKLGRPAAADPHMRAALALIGETDPVGRRDAYDLASQIAAALGRSDDALVYLRSAEKIRNELGAATMRSAIADANAQTAVAEREARLATRAAEWATQRSRLLAWTAAAVILLILVGVMLFVRLRARALEQRYAAVLDERTRMARELHDTILQGFTGITLQLRAASRSDPRDVNAILGTMADEAGRWASETRQAVWGMRAATTVTDLKAGLELAVATTRMQGDVDVSLDYAVDANLEPEAIAALLRVAQEALSNAARHSGAAHIAVRVEATDTTARLSVVDDGIGFTAAPGLSALGGHWGLLGMRERTEAMGGVFRVHSTPGAGTRILAEMPL